MRTTMLLSAPLWPLRSCLKLPTLFPFSLHSRSGADLDWDVTAGIGYKWNGPVTVPSA